MDSKTANMVTGLVMMVITIGLFLWLWTMSKAVPDSVAVAENLKPVETSNFKSDVEELISDLENKGEIPVVVDIEKLGRDNPFSPLGD